MASTGQAAGAGMAECAGRRGKEHARARAENPKTPQPRGCGGRSTSVAPTSSPLSHELSSHAPGGTAPRATHTHTLRGAAQHPNHTPPPRATRVPHAHRSGAHAALLSLLSVGELGHASLFRLPAFRPTQEGRGGGGPSCAPPDEAVCWVRSGPHFSPRPPHSSPPPLNTRSLPPHTGHDAPRSPPPLPARHAPAASAASRPAMNDS